MSITVQCDKCENTFELDDKWAGKTVVCRKCGNDFKAPGVSGTTSSGPSRRRGLIAAGVLVLALGGGASYYLASSTPSRLRIDSSSEESFKDTLEQMRASIPDARRGEFDKALTLVAMKDNKSVFDMATSSRVPGLTETQIKQALDGKTADQILAEAAQVLAERKAAREAEEERKREAIVEIEAKRQREQATVTAPAPQPVQEEPPAEEREKRTVVLVREQPLKPKVREEPEVPEEATPAPPELSKEEKAVNDALVELTQPYDAKNRFKRRDIASSLGTYGEHRERILPVLVKTAMSDPDMWTRRRAFWSLAEMGKQDKGSARIAITTLSKAAQVDQDESNRKAAKQAIEKLLGTEPKK